jgi:serine/threonine-protein kinase
MKSCPKCFRLYDDTSGFCPLDGEKLGVADPASPPTSGEDKRIGKTTNGRYVLWRVVADGGMGRVYQALDTGFTDAAGKAGRGVALKILHQEVAQDPVSVERFKREYEVSAGLPHQHIVEVFSFERTDDGSYALVMEYLEGEELRMLLKREKTMRPARVVRMASQVAIGLAGAHAKRQVHRDLKPDNLFLCHTAEGDTTKILDFGSVRDNSENAKKLTVMGTTIGSPYYMAPEQAQGLQSLDHRADVWSLAAIVYECLTGKVPFPGNTGPAILLAILTQDPPPMSEAGKEQGLPVTLNDVIEVALAKSPDIRQASIGAFADALGAAFGLTGGHLDWARRPESELAAAIERDLPGHVAAHATKLAAAPDLSAMDAAFKSSRGPDNLPQDYVIMGLPPARPAWFWPAVIGGAMIVIGGVVGVLLALR